MRLPAQIYRVCTVFTVPYTEQAVEIPCNNIDNIWVLQIRRTSGMMTYSNKYTYNISYVHKMCIGMLSVLEACLKPSYPYEGTGQQLSFGFWMQQMVSLSMSASKVYQPYSKSVVVNQEADFQIGRKMTSNYNTIKKTFMWPALYTVCTFVPTRTVVFTEEHTILETAENNQSIIFITPVWKQTDLSSLAYRRGNQRTYPSPASIVFDIRGPWSYNGLKHNFKVCAHVWLRVFLHRKWRTLRARERFGHTE